MRKGYLDVIVVLLLLFFQNLHAQNQANTLSRFRLLLTNGDRIEGKNGVLTNSGLKGLSTSGTRIDIPVRDIRFMDRYAGSQAGKGAAIGAGMGLLTALLIIIQADLDETRALKVDEGGLLGGFTLGGGLIGLAIGAGYSNWERVPIRTLLQIRPQHNDSLIKISFAL